MRPRRKVAGFFVVKMPKAPPVHRRKTVGKIHTNTAHRYDRRRGTANARGYTYKWQKASKVFLKESENVLCACGCGRLSEVVDHKIPHKGDMNLFWDRSNWQGMAKCCHDIKTAREDGGYGNRRTAR